MGAEIEIEVQPVRQAVILAAGNGSRMATASPRPKPLVDVGGEPLLTRLFRSLAECRVENAVVVLGYRAEEIREYPIETPDGLSVTWVYNPLFSLPNGHSLLAAEPHVRGHFLVLMADHLFERSTLPEFIGIDAPDGGGVLATDSKLDKILDLEDATKVGTQEKRLRQIGKELRDFDSLDTGLFKLSQSVFPALRKSISTGDGSLSGGIGVMAKNDQMNTWDIGARRWVDIDTPQDLVQAERLFRAGAVG